MSKRIIFVIAIHVAILLMVILLFFPTFWMVSTALKQDGHITIMPPEIIPHGISLEGFQRMLSNRTFLRFYLNSVIVSLCVIGVCFGLGVPAAYAFSRFKFKGSSKLLLFLLIAQMFPWVLLLIPIYRTFLSLHLLDTYLGLILVNSTLALPFCTWIFKGFFDSIPRQLDEAAYIDGCGRFGALYRVTLPLTTPGIIAGLMYAFILSWNDYLFCLTLITREQLRTLPVGIMLTYVSEFYYMWRGMMSASILISIPLVVAFVLLQRYLVSGLTLGAVKG